jgi:hypothetical protein
MRKPNCTCSVCGKPVYRRPWELAYRIKNAYCSTSCLQTVRPLIPSRDCESCGKLFKPETRAGRFCSKSCAARASRNRFGTAGKNGGYKTATQARLVLLKQLFKFETCMVEGCNYSKTYDVHRLVPGRDGGTYSVGNMFAICPNHHAEIERKLISVEKVNDYTLRIVLEGTQDR